LIVDEVQPNDGDNKSNGIQWRAEMKKRVGRCIVSAVLATAALTVAIKQTPAEVVVRGGKEGEPESEIRKAPAYVYPDFHTVAAQPSPSEVNPSFFGPVLLMKSAAVDL
jgi:hypothetical protein